MTGFVFEKPVRKSVSCPVCGKVIHDQEGYSSSPRTRLLAHMSKHRHDEQSCPTCGNDYQRVAGHWSKSDCDHPELTELQRDIVVGSLMGDASIDQQEVANGRLDIGMITPRFLVWLDRHLGTLSNGVGEGRSAAESAKNTLGRGFRSGARAEDYSDMYRLRTKTHPTFTEMYQKWYGSGKKSWPHQSIDLSPTVLLCLHCQDGCFDDKGGHRHISIGCSNERMNKYRVSSLFSRAGLPIPSWNEGQRKDGSWRCSARWSVEQSRALFIYMTRSPLWDGPPPGFEYKFPAYLGGSGRDMRDLERAAVGRTNFDGCLVLFDSTITSTQAAQAPVLAA